MKLGVSPFNETAMPGASPPEALRSVSPIRLWLVCLAFFYPLAWASNFLVAATPALVRVIFFGERLKYVRMTPFNMVAMTSAADVSRTFRRGGDLLDLAITGLLVIVLVAFAALVPRGCQELKGLAIAWVAQAALPRVWWAWTPPRQSFAELVLSEMVCFGALTWGLRTLVRAIPGGYWSRLVTALAAFGLPLVIFAGSRGPLEGYGFYWRWAILPVIPAVIASLLAALRAPRSSIFEQYPVSWRIPALGLATTVLLAAGATWAGKELDRYILAAKQAANRAAMASVSTVSPNLSYPKLFFQRGVNLTAQFPDTYDSEGARQMLDSMPFFGVNAVALVPYGFERRGEPQVRLASERSWENDEGLRELSQLAHAHMMKVMLKPGVWVGGGYAGDLEFASPADRAHWFASYGVFIEHYARLATEIHADILSVGGEFSKLTPYEADWRKLIARVRQLYPGPLVYAANHGDEFEHLAFWDALDYIGLQEYYPLPDDLSTEEIVRKVGAVQEKFQRPVIFTEAGFPSSERPNREPWDDSKAGKISLDDQARCYEAVFHAFYAQPWFAGMYWWDIRTDADGGPQNGSHTPWGKPAMEVIKHWYRGTGR